MKQFYSLVFAILMITNCLAQKQKLELNLSKGETYSLTMISSSSLNIPWNRKHVKAGGQGYDKLKFKVIDIHDSIYDMVVKCDSVSYKGNYFNLVIGNYSESGANIPDDSKNMFLKRLITSLKEKPFLVTMTKKGRVIEVKNIDPDTSKFQHLCNKTFELLLKSIPAMFPDSMESKGDKWNIKTKLETGISSYTETTYELKEATDIYLLVSGISILKQKGNEANGQNTIPGITPDLTTTTYSNIKIDKKTGWIIDAKINQIGKGTIKVKKDPKKPGDKGFPFTINTKTTLTGK